MSSEDKAQFIMAIRNYKNLKTTKKRNLMDITAQDENDQKILIRSIEPTGRNGYVNVDDVRDMKNIMVQEDFDQGVMVSKRFTTAAENQMKTDNIQRISEEYMPHFDSTQIYFAISNCVNLQCIAKCGKVPAKKSDCKPEKTICKVKSISDNAVFHFEHGWVGLMENDLKKLLTLDKPQEVLQG